MSEILNIPAPSMVLCYVVEINDPNNRWERTNKFEVAEYRVLGENDLNFVIDDLFFTTISKKSGDLRTSLGKSSINITNGDGFWGNSIRYRLYTDVKKRRATIKREIEQTIIKKFGFFMSDLDLRILDKEPTTGGAA